MKFDKWTVALAAIGVVSLASAAKAEEKVSSVLSAASPTTISGFVDTSAQWNFGTGNNGLPPYRFGGASKADGFNLNAVQVRIEKPLDEADWAAGYRADLWAGPDANMLGTQFGARSDLAIRQAYVHLRAPVYNGLEFKVGVFDSILGYESLAAVDNPNYTRSYGNSIEPTTQTGALASYRFNELVSASAGVANTYGPRINQRNFWPLVTDATQAESESYKAYMASISLTAPQSLGFLAGSTLDAGIINGSRIMNAASSTNVTSYYVGSTLATPIAGLRLGAAFDYYDVHTVNNQTWAVAGYANYQATEKLSFHFRGEYFVDKDPAYLFPVNARVLSLTGTAQYELWKNVLSRLEVRWDHSLSGNDVFDTNSSNVPTAKNAWMMAANIIYRF